MFKIFKLNNKGMTTVEILVSFIIVAAISSSIYATVANFNAKRDLESDKLKIYTYKNTLTKIIQDDLVKNGLVSVQRRDFTEDNKRDIYIVDLELKDHTTKRLVVKRQLANDYLFNKKSPDYESKKREYEDYFMILYGTPQTAITSSDYGKNLEEFPLPEVGYSYNGTEPGYRIEDFRLVNVIINSSKTTFSLFLGFQDVDEGGKYAINIVSPINYEA